MVRLSVSCCATLAYTVERCSVSRYHSPPRSYSLPPAAVDFLRGAILKDISMRGFPESSSACRTSWRGSGINPWDCGTPSCCLTRGGGGGHGVSARTLVEKREYKIITVNYDSWRPLVLYNVCFHFPARHHSLYVPQLSERVRPVQTKCRCPWCGGHEGLLTGVQWVQCSKIMV